MSYARYNGLVSASPAGGVLTIGTIDSEGSPSSNGATIVGTALVLQSASVTAPGLVNGSTQSFAGDKTFTGAVVVATLEATTAGDATNPGIFITPSGSNKFGFGVGAGSKPGLVGYGGVNFLVFNTSSGGGSFFSQVQTNAGFPGGINAISYIIGADSGTGFYSVSTGAWGFASGSTQYVQLDSSGLTALGGAGLNIEGSTSGTFGLRAPATVTPYNVIVPAAQGTGALTNDGSGNLSWAASGSGANTTLSNLTAPTAVNQDLNLGAHNILGLGGITFDTSVSDPTIQSGKALGQLQLLGFDASATPSTNGGDATIQGGSGGTTGNGGTASVVGGGANNGSNGGQILAFGSLNDGTGGEVDVISGDGNGNVGGIIQINAGAGDTGFAGGSIVLAGGNGNAGGTNSAILIINGGDGATTAGEAYLSGHFVSQTNGQSPPAATVKAALGSGGTAAFSTNSNDTTGMITLTAGVTSLSTGDQVDIVFNMPYSSTPIVVFFPTSTHAGANLVGAFISASSATGFSISFTTAATLNQVYSWNYIIVGNIA